LVSFLPWGGLGFLSNAEEMALERGMQAVVTAIAFNALAALFIILRCISRFWVIHQAGTEDYLIIFALILSCGTTATIALRKFFSLIFSRRYRRLISSRTSEQKNGLGRHADTVSIEENETLSKVSSPGPLPDCAHSC
jgi:hypothetical protein